MQYRVRPGKMFGKDGSLSEGAVVTLTEKEAEGFMDKLEPVAVDDPQTSTEDHRGEIEAEAVPTPSSKPETPQRTARQTKAKAKK